MGRLGVLLIVFSAVAWGGGGARAQTPLDGATQFRNQRGTCHTLDPNAPSRQGPMLRGVVGREAGTVPGLKYSPHLQNAGFAWTENQPELWPKLGYEGLSAEYGGYLNRGFNDIDWLPTS